ncbi:MAG: putative DNA-binding domain-containing protein [Acidobacteriia bacterium]|nr:putative DNA-binding domain-containing protein [Terriglobia bacterium]
MRPDSLPRLQRWMQAVILTPGDCEEALASEAATREIGVHDARGVILPSKTLQPNERLDIYRDMYEARLLEALSVDYPGLADLLGEELFAELLRLYIRAHPSRSYTLNDLGDNLPEFLRLVEGLPRAQFAYDLARLELAYSKIFDAAETPPLSHEAITAVPAGAWEKARLVPVAAFQLIAMRYPAQLYLEALREEKLPPPIRRKDTWLAIYRRDYAVMALSLTRPAFDVLSALAAGNSLGDAILAGKMNTPTRHRLLTTMFQSWTSEGLFQAIRTEPRPKEAVGKSATTAGSAAAQWPTE